MKVAQLIKKLQSLDPEATVIMTVCNGHVRTYALADSILQMDYDGVYADLFGTPGKTDDRILKIDSENVVSIDTLFHKYAASEGKNAK